MRPTTPQTSTDPRLDQELERREGRGAQRLSVAAMGARFLALGYRLDRSLDCKGIARLSDGSSYPCTTTGVKEADTGLSAFNAAARRDDAFRAMQALRNEVFAVVGGYILEA